MTTAAIECLPSCAPRVGVVSRLGLPTSHPVERVVGQPDLRRIPRAAKRFDPNGGGDLRAVCCRGGRLAAQRDW